MAVVFKRGVVLEPRTPTLDYLLTVLGQASDVFHVTLVITAGYDSHTSGSHPKGKAVDVRMAPFSDDKILAMLTWIRQTLDDSIYIQYETRTKPTDKALSLHRLTIVTTAASGKHFHLQLRKALDELPAEVAARVTTRPTVGAEAA